MAMGLKVIGDAGTTQIDADYNNLALATRSTIQVTTPLPFSGSLGYYDLSWSGNTPVLALIAQTGEPCLIYGINRSGSVFTWRIVSNLYAFVDFFIYDTCSPSAPMAQI